jgi:hypothetical protein
MSKNAIGVMLSMLGLETFLQRRPETPSIAALPRTAREPALGSAWRVTHRVCEGPPNPQRASGSSSTRMTDPTITPGSVPTRSSFSRPPVCPLSPIVVQRPRCRYHVVVKQVRRLMPLSVRSSARYASADWRSVEPCELVSCWNSVTASSDESHSRSAVVVTHFKLSRSLRAWTEMNRGLSPAR